MPPPVRTRDADYHFHVYDYAASVAFTESPPQPARNGWTFYSLVRDLDGLRITANVNQVPNPVVANLGAQITDDGANRWVQSLSIGGTNPGVDSEVVITGGIHAREWIAVEFAYLLAEYLIRNYTAHPANRYQQWLHDLIDSRRIHIIPMLNPAGNAYTVFSLNARARMWRRNRHPLPNSGVAWQAALTNPIAAAPWPPWPPFQNVVLNAGQTSYDAPRYVPGGAAGPLDTVHLPNNPDPGVDLARNFTALGYGHTNAPRYDNGEPNTEAYFGPKAASELETQAVQAFVAGLGPVATACDYHSFSKLVLYPTEQAHAGLPPNYTQLGEILQRLIGPQWSWGFGYDYQLGSPVDLLGYDATGTPADHIAARAGAPRAFVIELDPARGTPDGFVLPQAQIRTVFEKNIRGALALIAAAGQQSTLANTTVCCCFRRRTITSGERVLLDWNVWGRGNQLPA